MFISVDPERDTPEMLRIYMNAFDPRFTALRGTPDQIQKAAKAFAAYFKKVPLDSGEYTMDHGGRHPDKVGRHVSGHLGHARTQGEPTEEAGAAGGICHVRISRRFARYLRRAEP
nr:SCO family protein [Sinorhizobium meliloti]